MAAFVLWQGALLVGARHSSAEAWPAVSAAASRWALARSPARMSPRELRVLPGIGERLALAVSDARRERGRRAAGAVEALAWEDVRGIGPRTAARVRAWLAAHGLETELEAQDDGSAGERPDARPGARSPEKTSAVSRRRSAGPAAHGKPW